MINLSQEDVLQIDERGISEEVLNKQVKLLVKGTEPIKLIAAATPENGIMALDIQQQNQFRAYFEENVANIELCRFVPASGAASRMFKALFQYLDDDIETKDIKIFAVGYQLFPFYDSIKCSDIDDFRCAIKNMLHKLRLANLPKALIPFHNYIDAPRTALEEHLVESAEILGENRLVNIHFTISQEHRAKFDELINLKVKKYEDDYKCKFKINFSYQSPKTDTVALTSENRLFRNKSNEIVFRPGGHGALIKNLNELSAPMIFIKNIDNVQPDHLKTDIILYKKILAGYLLFIQGKISTYLQHFNELNKIDELIDFVQNVLQIKLPSLFHSLSSEDQKLWLFNKLNRPIRVCGMVKNEGEPGGGPFWVVNKENEESLQIVESSQINLKDKNQQRIFNQSTHFNPVDIVCWLTDYKDNKFDLTKFTDPETAFITEKSQNGQSLKVLEHPGLWNGAMANWITIFVEVPISTFSPVKTINDLLKEAHQIK